MTSRRNFIKNTTLTAGSLPFVSMAFNKLQQGKKLGVALVGLGNYSTHQLAPALQLTNLCKLTAIVTGSPDKATKWANQYDIPQKNIYNYKNFDQIKDNNEVDIVYVVLPNSMHAEYTIRAANAGKHVICEKPMALNSTECKAMIAACNKNQVQLSIGYRLYFDPYHLEMRRFAQEKIYGKVKMIESSLGFSMADPKVWRLNKALGGGGAIMDLGVYCIQGVRRTLNELPVSVTAQGFVHDTTVFKDIYEGMTFQMNFKSGVISNSTTTYSSYVDRLHITTGWQSYGLEPSYNATGAAGKIRENEIKELKFSTKKYQQIDQMDDFANCILDQKKSVANGEEGLIDLKIIEAIKLAADTNKKIFINWDKM